MSSKMKKGFAVVLALCLMCGSFSLWADPVYPLDAAAVPAIDRWAMTSYSSSLSMVSTLGEGAMLGLPVLLALPSFMKGERETVLQMGGEYAVVMAGTWATKELLKTAVARQRPYMYTDNPPADKIAEGDWNKSFPSGHTSISFAAASYFTYSFCQLYPESDWKWAAGAAAYTGASAVAAMRVASANHFITDVAAGAVIGTLWGYGVPLVNRWLNAQLGTRLDAALGSVSSGSRPSASALVLPTGVAVGVRW